MPTIDDISSRPFRADHLDIFKVKESHRSECMNNAKVMHALGRLDQFGSHMLDGRILYVAGYMTVAPGVIEVYMHPSIYVDQHPKIFAQHVRWLIQHFARHENARRVQTWGDCSPTSDRWLRFLGFVNEAVLHSYRPDGDSSIWGMVICKR